MARALPGQPGGLTFQWNGYGRALRDWNRLDESEAAFRAGVEEATAFYGAGHPITASARADWSGPWPGWAAPTKGSPRPPPPSRS